MGRNGIGCSGTRHKIAIPGARIPRSPGADWVVEFSPVCSAVPVCVEARELLSPLHLSESSRWHEVSTFDLLPEGVEGSVVGGSVAVLAAIDVTIRQLVDP